MNLGQRVHHLLSPLIYRDGTAIVPSEVAGRWPERDFLRRFLKRLNVDCVLDVGANIGQYGSQLRLIGFTGTILSFEPDPAAFAALRAATARDPRWNAFNHALGEVTGVAELNLMGSSDFNSFREPSTGETTHFSAQNRVVETVAVQVQRLDAVLPELRMQYGFQRPFLKTDTQGFDVEVFRGASGVHAQLVGIQCELPLKRLYEGAPTWTEALEEYSGAGFEIVGIFNVNPAEPFLIECDCFFQPKGG